MDDRQLLELAAKAAGYVVRWYEDSLAYGSTYGIEVEPGNPLGFVPWNPRTDDGDAFRLLHSTYKKGATTLCDEWIRIYDNLWGGSIEDTRLAIVRHAAAIGATL